MGANQLKCIFLCLISVFLSAVAHADDTGLILEAEAQKKINKKFNVSLSGEFRSRNDWRTADRVALGVGADYKLTKWLKADAGYQLLIDNNPQKLTFNPDGTFNNWRPSYWGTRHRIYASLTASVKWQRVTFSLRERWRYTYRPEKTTTRYDFDNEYWEDKDVQSIGKHALRSRLKMEWDIPNCKFTPFASVELFNNWSLAKTRLTLGSEYTLQKKHVFSLYYRYQNVRDKDEDESNGHHIGLSYKFKF